MRFENESDLDRETKAIKIFCEKFKATYKKLGENDIDFCVKKKDKICYIEVKGRNRNLIDAYPLPLAARKMVKLVDKGHQSIIIWDCYDVIIYGNTKDLISQGKMGGRKPRVGSFNDKEYMLYFEEQENLLLIKKDKDGNLN